MNPGIVNLEAMAMKKPVAVGARGVVGFREQVLSSGPDKNGVHVNGTDPIDIVWGIKETLRNPEKARNWGENGRERVLEYFTWRKVADETVRSTNHYSEEIRYPNARVVSKTRIYDKGATLKHPQDALLFNRYIRKLA